MTTFATERGKCSRNFLAYQDLDLPNTVEEFLENIPDFIFADLPPDYENLASESNVQFIKKLDLDYRAFNSELHDSFFPFLDLWIRMHSVGMEKERVDDLLEEGAVRATLALMRSFDEKGQYYFVGQGMYPFYVVAKTWQKQANLKSMFHYLLLYRKFLLK